MNPCPGRRGFNSVFRSDLLRRTGGAVQQETGVIRCDVDQAEVRLKLLLAYLPILVLLPDRLAAAVSGWFDLGDPFVNGLTSDPLPRLDRVLVTDGRQRKPLGFGERVIREPEGVADPLKLPSFPDVGEDALDVLVSSIPNHDLCFPRRFLLSLDIDVGNPFAERHVRSVTRT